MENQILADKLCEWMRNRKDTYAEEISKEDSSYEEEEPNHKNEKYVVKRSQTKMPKRQSELANS